MATTRWDPMSELAGMRRELDRLLGRVGGLVAGGEAGRAEGWMPRWDVKSGQDEVIIYAEVPGLTSDDIDVEVTDDALVIKGERQSETEKTEEGWVVRERSYGAFERSLPLPKDTEADKITAEYKEGVLEIHIPQTPAALKPPAKKIAIGAPAEKTTEPAAEAEPGAAPTA